MKETNYKTEIGGRKVEITLGKYCGQANGHCIVTCGETVIMVNATSQKLQDLVWTFSHSVLTTKKKCTA